MALVDRKYLTNPLIWVFVYLISLSGVALICVILAPFNIGVSIMALILDIGIRIGLIAIIIVTLALIVVALKDKMAK